MARKTKRTGARKATSKTRRKTKRAGAARERPAKKTTSSKRSKRSSGGESALTSVRVRMYRVGLGDCFLISFDADGEAKHMLIDCGTLGSKSAGGSLKRIVKQITDDIGDTLHALIVTHEHWDHVSAFKHYGETLCDALDVREVWMAWTENPDDPLARKLSKHRNDLRLALAGALHAAPPGCDAAPLLDGLLGFFGDTSPFAAGKFAESTDEAMDFARTQFVETPRYLRPDAQPFTTGWLPGFRFYVLGPPRDEAALRRLGDHGSEELYGLRGALGLGGSSGVETMEDEHSPFDSRHRCHDVGHAAAWLPRYFEPENRWRAIDHDWLNSASHLALQLDSMTNNTSLVLAIERVADGKVLLFPADAQEGSWVSWHGEEMSWTVPDDRGRSREVDTADLLSRTVFYKVGHHASHNATAREKGLEMMGARGELVAFIPVDREIALSRNPKGSWKMPARTLYRRLLEKCDGLVARADIGFATDPGRAAEGATESEFVGMATKAEWKRWKQSQDAAQSTGRIGEAPSYIEFTLG